MTKLCNQFKVKHQNSTPYRPQMNGAMEAANKNIKNILEKMTETYRDWHDKLPFTLMAYKTTTRTSTGATPFSLVYGMEAVVPVEVEIPSLRVLKEVEWLRQSGYNPGIPRSGQKSGTQYIRRVFRHAMGILKLSNIGNEEWLIQIRLTPSSFRNL
ncbi:uncharacterized protein LOC131153952 [Malania oleifera]|uniref:uncharacterized protein LOC131153952 n=1 Tax=Malania oleifera TaxID=397392 RepID=UPI0025ADD92F|nr:uncharacterized protein LOC131153952 [Malania oleifera]